PAPALSIKASTSTPRAKAACSTARICAEVKIGEVNQPSFSRGVTVASISAGFDDFFFFAFELRLCERFEREPSESRTLVSSMYDCNGMLSPVPERVELEALVTEKRPRIPVAISSASFWR